MTAHYRIVHDKFLEKFFIQRKFLFWWVKWCQSLNDERWKKTNCSYWGFQTQSAAEEHLMTFFKEEEDRRRIEEQMNAKDRMVVIHTIKVK